MAGLGILGLSGSDLTNYGGALSTTTISATDDITIATGKAIKTDTTTAHTVLLKAYDVDNTTYRTFLTLTNGNTPTIDISAPSGGSGTIDNIVIGSVTPVNAQFSNPINVQTGTTYTIVALDCGKIITFNNASAITVTLPQQSTTTTTAGFQFRYQNIGVGTVTFVKEGAETLTGNTTAITGASGSIWRNTTTNWNHFGGSATVTDIEVGEIDLVTNNVYNIILYAPFAGTITAFTQSATAITTAGTYTVKINSSTVTGLSAITNTTAITRTAATAANTFVIGDAISITFASTSVVTNYCYQLDFTRTY